jgi:solute:Na+ symporter, SSS family
VVALLAPAVWGLFSRTIDGKAVWLTGGIGLGAGLLVRGGLAAGGVLEDVVGFQTMAQWVQANGTYVTTFTGVVLPIAILGLIQLLTKKPAAGYARVEALAEARKEEETAAPSLPSRMPAIIVGWALLVCAVMMTVLVIVNQEGRDRLVIGIFGAIVLLLGIAILVGSRKAVGKAGLNSQTD